MQLAVDCAGFSAAEADQLRRAMGSKRSTERMRRLRGRFYDGMRAAARHHRRGGRPDLREAGGVRQFRLPRKPFAELRVAGVLLVVVQAAPPGGVLRGAAAGAADGLLLAAVAGRRRPPARGDRARARTSTPAWRTPRWRTTALRCGWASAASATSATSLAEQIVDERKANGPFDLSARPDRTGAAVACRRPRRWPPPARWAASGSPAAKALWAAGAAATQRPGPAAGRGVVVAYPVAARHDRAGAGRRRRVGHRHLTGQLSHPVPAGGPRRASAWCPPTSCWRCPTAPGCWSRGR